ncbi:hypothetical protein TSAR_011554 [Trichomalopsis sarcophagae]|uniref:DDE Tnp4 domain-containing protein n=1 Tax=Trichomalopsis sarcophagae TaxID=543379 RepID=A0A232EIJ1_9HYME|nr:hypothetical protein TSAR_011554 [Trichomalopsis sarcophagae]
MNPRSVVDLSTANTNIKYPILKSYPDKFVQYMRMQVSTFEYVLSRVAPSLTKKWCNLHVQPIFSEERLVLTLRRRGVPFLSRARVVVENAFARTSQKWCILYTNIDKSPEIVKLIIQCTCVLHNVIMDLENKIPVYTSIAEQTTEVEGDDILVAPATGEEIQQTTEVEGDDVLVAPATGEEIRLMLLDEWVAVAGLMLLDEWVAVAGSCLLEPS